MQGNGLLRCGRDRRNKVSPTEANKRLEAHVGAACATARTHRSVRGRWLAMSCASKLMERAGSSVLRCAAAQTRAQPASAPPSGQGEGGGAVRHGRRASEALLPTERKYWGLPGACPRFIPLTNNALNPLRPYLHGPLPHGRLGSTCCRHHRSLPPAGRAADRWQLCIAMYDHVFEKRWL